MLVNGPMVQRQTEFTRYGDCPFDIEPVLPAVDIVLPSVQHFAVVGIATHAGLRLQNCVVHTDSLEAPVAYAYLPAPQLVHAALSGSAAYFPAAQGVQTPPRWPDDPALHAQRSEPAGELAFS